MGNYLTHLNKFLWHPLNISSVQFSHSVVSDSLWPQAQSLLKLVHWVGDAIQPSQPLPLPSPPTFNISQHQGFFKWVSSSHQVAKVLEFQFQHPSNEYSGLISFIMDWLDLPAIHGTLKSSPTPQFKSISSSAFSFLYSPTLTSIHDYWKNHSLD